ncbi:MAG: hypothetical protein LBJ38_00675 [Oscillospiraceae bacterium]|jgi:preprotein translocase subunit SecD|nr:hypothetical protein [Oscillospiraceae bacterium]
MKKVKKSIFFLVAVMILFFLWLSFFGIRKTHGDVTTVYVKGVRDLFLGTDIGGGIEFVFKAVHDKAMTQSDMETAKKVLERRLFEWGIDGDVFASYDQERFIVRIPFGYVGWQDNAGRIMKKLCKRATITFREKAETDADGNPKDETLLNVILAGNEIEKASSFSRNAVHGVSFKLTKPAKEKLQAATKKLAETYDQFSVWVDNRMIAAPKVNEPVDGGRVLIAGLESIETANDLAATINAGALPFGLVAESANAIESSFGICAQLPVFVGVSVLFAAVLLFMACQYRLLSGIYLFVLIGFCGFVIGTVTGFFPFVPGATLSIPIMFGIAFVFWVNAVCSSSLFGRIKRLMGQGNTAKKAVELSLQAEKAKILKVNGLVFVCGIVLMGCFGAHRNLVASVLQPVLSAVDQNLFPLGKLAQLGYVFIAGSFFNPFLWWLQSLMLRSCARFRAFKQMCLSPLAEPQKVAVATKGIIIPTVIACALLAFVVRGNQQGSPGNTFARYACGSGVVPDDTENIAKKVVAEEGLASADIQRMRDIKTDEKGFVLSLPKLTDNEEVGRITAKLISRMPAAQIKNISWESMEGKQLNFFDVRLLVVLISICLASCFMMLRKAKERGMVAVFVMFGVCFLFMCLMCGLVRVMSRGWVCHAAQLAASASSATVITVLCWLCFSVLKCHVKEDGDAKACGLCGAAYLPGFLIVVGVFCGVFFSSGASIMWASALPFLIAVVGIGVAGIVCSVLGLRSEKRL